MLREIKGAYFESVYTVDEVLGMLDGGEDELTCDGSDDNFGVDVEDSSDSDER